MLANHLNCKICYLDLATVDRNNLIKALSPVLKSLPYGYEYDDLPFDRSVNKKKNTKILLVVEDFDRFLKNTIENSDNGTIISAILNALDGMYEVKNIIRIFTANSLECISDIGAIISRFNYVFKLDLPSYNDIVIYINNFKQSLIDNNTHYLPKEIEKMTDKDIQEYENNINTNIKIISQLFYDNKFSYRTIIYYMTRYISYDDPIKESIDNFNEWLISVNQMEEYKKNLPPVIDDSNNFDDIANY